MKPDWLESPVQDHWTARLSPYCRTVPRTMFGSYSYSVADSTQVVRSGNVATPEVAKMVAEDAAKTLAEAS